MGKDFRGGSTGGRGGSRGGRGGGRGGRGGKPGLGRKPIETRVEPHRFEGIYIAKGKEELLVTKNLAPGETVYGEKKIPIEVS